MNDNSQEPSEEAKRMAYLRSLCEQKQEKVLGMHPGPLPALVSLYASTESSYFTVRVWAYTAPGEVHKVVQLNAEWVAKNEVELCDISSNKRHTNKGYGSLAMPFFFDYVKSKGGKRIRGWLSSVDWDHAPRLVHFYEKHGFTVKMREGMDLNGPAPEPHFDFTESLDLDGTEANPHKIGTILRGLG